MRPDAEVLELLEQFDREGKPLTAEALRALRPPKAARAPRGTWESAFLVTDYFAVENRLRAPVRWRIKARRGSAERFAVLRADLARLQSRFGVTVQGFWERLAEPVEFGPLPLPVGTRFPARPPVPSGGPLRDLAERPRVVGSWYFRSGLASRPVDRRPLWTCTGLLT